MKYHVFKQTRVYGGYPYEGSSCEAIGTSKAEANSIDEAMVMAERLQSHNPVGWNIWDSSTGKLVDGYDFFAELETEVSK